MSLQATLIQLHSTGDNEKEQPEIDTPSYLRYDPPLLDNARDSATHGQDALISKHSPSAVPGYVIATGHYDYFAPLIVHATVLALQSLRSKQGAT